MSSENFELKDIGSKDVYIDVFDNNSTVKWSKVMEPVKDLAYFEFRFRAPTSNDEHNSLYNSNGVLKSRHQVDHLTALFLSNFYSGKINDN